MRLLTRSLGLGLAAAVSLFQHDAAADPIACAEQADGEYVRIDFGTGITDTIGPLAQYFLVGAFAGDDFSREYAIEYPSGDLYSIDTATAQTRLIGPTDISDQIPTAMQWDPVNNYMLLMTDYYSPCDGGNFYALDVATGAAQLIGTQDGCLAGLAFDADGNAFSIDVAADTLVELGTGTIGPLGVNVALLSALFFDPSDDQLYLIAADVDTASNDLFIVDTASGQATLVAPWPDQYSAFALETGAVTDTVFANGFDTGAASAN
ncbi:MAG TPA: hypothetical protein VMJ74_04480 [Pseudomonadales bacterium]|nr:hypothetical protein [Pseudomonadales bacterium]